MSYFYQQTRFIATRQDDKHRILAYKSFAYVCRFDTLEAAEHSAHILNVHTYGQLGLSPLDIKELEKRGDSKYGITKEKDQGPFISGFFDNYGYKSNPEAWWVIVRI